MANAYVTLETFGVNMISRVVTTKTGDVLETSPLVLKPTSISAENFFCFFLADM